MLRSSTKFRFDIPRIFSLMRWARSRNMLKKDPEKPSRDQDAIVF